MDRAYEIPRAGDCLVFRLTSYEAFRSLVKPYVNQNAASGRRIIYIRFASHDPLLAPQEGLEIIPVELSHRFETFTVAIHDIIARYEEGSLFVFDCLSELMTAWSTDLMMENFFRVTCPFLIGRGDVAYFPLIRGNHSGKANTAIRNEARVVLDVLSGDGTTVYVRAEKVWDRYADEMFIPYAYDPRTGDFLPLKEGAELGRFYETVNITQTAADSHNRDSWERFFDDTYQNYQNGRDVTEACARMCRIMLSRDTRIREMVDRHFSPLDYFRVWRRLIGTGLIGGKACGMLLARKIIENERPDIYSRIEPHDSFYIGSDVFYTYIVENGFWDLRIRQRRSEEYFSLSEELTARFMSGHFPRGLEDQFVRLLEYYGHDPIIVRSSSILEDGFGNAFAGKYESVFCSNTGTLDERLEDFRRAVRTVYASTMSLSALDYRKRRGLDKRDEQMALLVMRVSGFHFGPYYMPCAAGVGYSLSPYRFLPSLDPKAGMLRLVMGLGTSAVDRREGSYPRLVSLDQPEASSANTPRERHQFSQRKIELVNQKTHRIEQVGLDSVKDLIPDYIKELVLERDYDAERVFRERGQRKEIAFISCRGLVRRADLMADLRELMETVQAEYQYPVDIEFTLNFSEEGSYRINLVQCRPLQALGGNGTAEGEPVMIGTPDRQPDPESIFLECTGASMGLSRHQAIDLIVYVDPVAYYNLPYRDKPRVGRAVGAVNWHFRGQDKGMALFVPGRVGTSSPELGVPLSFADISEYKCVAEIAESRAGYRPELSYGSHFFQDLVEADILYTAVFENEKTRHFHPEKLSAVPNLLTSICPEAEDLAGLIRVAPVSATLLHDMGTEHTLVLCH